TAFDCARACRSRIGNAAGLMDFIGPSSGAENGLQYRIAPAACVAVPCTDRFQMWPPLVPVKPNKGFCAGCSDAHRKAARCFLALQRSAGKVVKLVAARRRW